MPNVDAAAAQRVINDNWVLEGRTVAERAASWYRLGASPISAKAAVKREIDAVYAMTALADLFRYCGDVTRPPEARLFAAAKIEAQHAVAADDREAGLLARITTSPDIFGAKLRRRSRAR